MPIPNETRPKPVPTTTEKATAVADRHRDLIWFLVLTIASWCIWAALVGIQAVSLIGGYIIGALAVWYALRRRVR